MPACPWPMPCPECFTIEVLVSIVTLESPEHSREDPSMIGIIRSRSVFVPVSSRPGRLDQTRTIKWPSLPNSRAV
jgi:hypothetical protein